MEVKYDKNSNDVSQIWKKKTFQICENLKGLEHTDIYLDNLISKCLGYCLTFGIHMELLVYFFDM